jgi:hypothetical protein
MHEYMDELQIKLNAIGEAIFQTYLFSPPLPEPEPEPAPVAEPKPETKADAKPEPRADAKIDGAPARKSTQTQRMTKPAKV